MPLSFRYLIRADGSKEIGLGHIYRTLALADCLGREHVIYLTNNNEIIESLLSGVNHVVLRDSYNIKLTLATMEEMVEKYDVKVIISDLLHYDDCYFDFVRRIGSKIVTFHEHTSHDRFSDMVINYNTFPGAFDLMRNAGRNCLGPKYAIFPKSLQEINRITIKEKVKKIFISFGGSDPGGLTKIVIKAIECTDYVAKNVDEILVHLGPSNSDIKEIESLVSKSKNNYKIYNRLPNIHSLMSEADLALAAGGNTMYELCCLGVPTIIIPQNEHQKIFARELAMIGAVSLPCGEGELNRNMISAELLHIADNKSLRKKMHDISINVFDTNGTLRIVEQLKLL